MSRTYEHKKKKNYTVLYTIASVLLIISVFLAMTASFFRQAEDDAYEKLHIQTKQIKDNLTLQMVSDRENLITMSNFAARLYINGQDYSLMFDSFKPIGLFSRIGILTPECVFITKEAIVDLSDRMSFEEQALLGNHITGRVYSYSVPDELVVRSSVPIKVDGETVGIMYGIINIERINEKYSNMAKELDAQLFVYDKLTGKFIVDTINTEPGELAELESREYRDGYSYQALRETDSGYSSFKSIFTGEDLYAHYSTLEECNWGIMLARYESEVFEETHGLMYVLGVTASIIALIVIAYILVILKVEKNRTLLSSESSAIRHHLLEINQQKENIESALKRIKEFAGAHSCFFSDTDGTDYYYIRPSLNRSCLMGADRQYFVGELFKYASDVHTDSMSTEYMDIVPNEHLLKTNPEFYSFLKKHGIYKVSYIILSDKRNLVSILGTVNAKRGRAIRSLMEDVAICFTIAVYNKKHLNHTELAATTDALTGVANRVAYNRDILAFDEEKPADFSCIYVDVNELHIRNNKYGHAAGDEMLIYIANTLKEVFYGHSIYRMGGDEYLVFAKGVDLESIKRNIEVFSEQLKPRGYHVAVGMSYRSQMNNCDEMVREAEIRMYEAKAKYYQDKEQQNTSGEKEGGYICTKTGIREIDAMISVLKEHYNGIYRVSLDTDCASRILMPSYLGYKENEENFSKLVKKYVENSVHPDYHRTILNFLNYDAIKRQISEGKTPAVTYKKLGGETVILSVYGLDNADANGNDTLWVFAKG